MNRPNRLYGHVCAAVFIPWMFASEAVHTIRQRWKDNHAPPRPK